MNTRLLLIDPQNDFCDIPPGEAFVAPRLPVSGADADMKRLALLIDEMAGSIDQVTVTLDTHSRFHIAHGINWRTRDGNMPAPFTIISLDAYEAGEFTFADPTLASKAHNYLKGLKVHDRYQLCIWPVHCEHATWGGDIHRAVQKSLEVWQESSGKAIALVRKGMNRFTEHYSAVAAEVEDPQDASTRPNQELIGWAKDCDRLVIAGEASSHCVKATVEHLYEFWGSGQPEMLIVTDCMSPVPGFEAKANEFTSWLTGVGATLISSKTLLNGGQGRRHV